jgi:predicted transcriptional regulator YdeE
MQRVKIEPFMSIGIDVRTTNEGQKAGQDIALLWQRFLSETNAADFETFAEKALNPSAAEVDFYVAVKE